MAYTPYYTNGWQDNESGGTPITADALNHIDTGIEDVADSIAFITDYNNAGSHNCIYRGKYLGTSVTDEQYEAISAGTFEDLYIGDYWTIDSVTYRIAAFDYYYNTGDTACTTHHVVLVPNSILYSTTMNDSADTSGGYVNSTMYTEGLDDAKTTISAAFSDDHILSHRIALATAYTSGRPYNVAWYSSTVDLMTENMVFGGPINMTVSNGAYAWINNRVEKTQLPLFAINPQMITVRQTYWLRDVASSTYYTTIYVYGNAMGASATQSFGVRPTFCIKA